MFLQSLSRIFPLIYLAIYFLSRIPKDHMNGHWGERKFSCRLFISSIEHEIMHFPVIVVQCGKEMYKKSLQQSCCLAYLNLLLFWRSHCCSHCGIFKSLIARGRLMYFVMIQTLHFWCTCIGICSWSNKPFLTNLINIFKMDKMDKTTNKKSNLYNWRAIKFWPKWK